MSRSNDKKLFDEYVRCCRENGVPFLPIDKDWVTHWKMIIRRKDNE